MGITDLSQYRESKLAADEGEADEGRTLTGPARCLHCRHEWVAVCMEGTTSMECPECSLMQGVFVHRVTAGKGEYRFVCNCGCDTYMVNIDGVTCSHCGVFNDYERLLGDE